MKLLLLSFLFLAGCAADKPTVTNNPTPWTFPTTTQGVQDEIASKTYADDNGRYFRFNADGTFEAKFRGAYQVEGDQNNYYRMYTCTVTASSYEVSRLSDWYGYFMILLTSPQVVKTGIIGTPTYDGGCTIYNQIRLIMTSQSVLKHNIFGLFGIGISQPPADSGYYIGDGKDDYNLQ